MEYDNILRQIGEFGLFQRRVVFILCLVNFPHCFNTLGYVFWAARLEHWCHVDRPAEFENISEKLWKNWTIPSKIDSTGQLQYESCLQYSYADNITLISQYLNDTHEDSFTVVPDNWTQWKEERFTRCKSWDYDTHQYLSSIVTKVNQPLLNLKCSKYAINGLLK